MEKLLSFFTPSDKRKGRLEGGEEVNDFTPPLDGRRKLSISRSGRMKQANKKRHSLSLALYGEDLQSVDKPKNLEYHVNNPSANPVQETSKRRRSADHVATDPTDSHSNDAADRRPSVDIKTPEEEIELAFKIIDKVS